MEVGHQIILIGFYNKKHFLNYGQQDNKVWLLFYHRWAWVEVVLLKMQKELCIKIPNSNNSHKKKKKKKKKKRKKRKKYLINNKFK